MACNLEDLISLVKLLNSKGVSVRFHKESLTFTGERNAMQVLLLGVLGSVYQVRAFDAAGATERGYTEG